MKTGEISSWGYGYRNGRCQKCGIGKKHTAFWKKFRATSWFRGDDEEIACLCGSCYRDKNNRDILASP